MPPDNPVPSSSGGGRGRLKLKTLIAMKHKETWKIVVQLLVSILTAVATTLGVASCM